jgi:hypothetical protein
MQLLPPQIHEPASQVMKTIRIGNGCGFWGDSVDAPIRLAEQGQLDYLTLEYLAELTMSILALLRQRDPNAGYATDFQCGWHEPRCLRRSRAKSAGPSRIHESFHRHRLRG